jgi:hypothetical protein
MLFLQLSLALTIKDQTQPYADYCMELVHSYYQKFTVAMSRRTATFVNLHVYLLVTIAMQMLSVLLPFLSFLPILIQFTNVNAKMVMLAMEHHVHQRLASMEYARLFMALMIVPSMDYVCVRRLSQQVLKILEATTCVNVTQLVDPNSFGLIPNQLVSHLEDASPNNGNVTCNNTAKLNAPRMETTLLPCSELAFATMVLLEVGNTLVNVIFLRRESCGQTHTMETYAYPTQNAQLTGIAITHNIAISLQAEEDLLENASKS